MSHVKLFSAQPGHVLAGRYRLEKVLGKGTYGAVLRAIDNTDSRAVAVKVQIKQDPKNALGHRQRKEQSTHRSVSHHPNIVTFIDSFDTKDASCIVLELNPAGDLCSAIERRAYRGDSPLVQRCFAQILDAVGFCHARGVYHRDIKPENILVSADMKNWYLSDFGLATNAAFSSQIGIGTSYFMAPEVLGTREFYRESIWHAAGDVWALGMTLCAAAFNGFPWQRADRKDKKFAKFLEAPEAQLIEALPFSRPLAILLVDVFAVDSERRTTTTEFARRLATIPTLYNSSVPDRHSPAGRAEAACARYTPLYKRPTKSRSVYGIISYVPTSSQLRPQLPRKKLTPSPKNCKPQPREVLLTVPRKEPVGPGRTCSPHGPRGLPVPKKNQVPAGGKGVPPRAGANKLPSPVGGKQRPMPAGPKAPRPAPIHIHAPVPVVPRRAPSLLGPPPLPPLPRFQHAPPANGPPVPTLLEFMSNPNRVYSPDIPKYFAEVAAIVDGRRREAIGARPLPTPGEQHRALPDIAAYLQAPSPVDPPAPSPVELQTRPLLPPLPTPPRLLTAPRFGMPPLPTPPRLRVPPFPMPELVRGLPTAEETPLVTPETRPMDAPGMLEVPPMALDGRWNEREERQMVVPEGARQTLKMLGAQEAKIFAAEAMEVEVLKAEVRVQKPLKVEVTASYNCGDYVDVNLLMGLQPGTIV